MGERCIQNNRFRILLPKKNMMHMKKNTLPPTMPLAKRKFGVAFVTFFLHECSRPHVSLPVQSVLRRFYQRILFQRAYLSQFCSDRLEIFRTYSQILILQKNAIKKIDFFTAASGGNPLTSNSLVTKKKSFYHEKVKENS